MIDGNYRFPHSQKTRMAQKRKHLFTKLGRVELIKKNRREIPAVVHKTKGTMMSEKTITKERLSQFMRDLNLNREDTATIFDCSTATVDKYLKGEAQTVSIDAVYHLAKIHENLFFFLCGDIIQIRVDKEKIKRRLIEIRRNQHGNNNA